ncbi:MAG: hypothetical protein WCL29_01120 [Pseudomonadota bacterium]
MKMNKIIVAAGLALFASSVIAKIPPAPPADPAVAAAKAEKDKAAAVAERAATARGRVKRSVCSQAMPATARQSNNAAGLQRRARAPDFSRSSSVVLSAAYIAPW